MTLLLRLADFSIRAPALVLGGWLVAILLSGSFWSLGDASLTSRIWLLGDSPAKRGYDVVIGRDPQTTVARIACAGGGTSVTGDERVISPELTENDIAALLIGAAQCYEQRWSDAGLTSPVTGDAAPLISYTSLRRAYEPESGAHLRTVVANDLVAAERLALPATLGILLIITRSPVLAVAPLVLGLISVAVASMLAMLVLPERTISVYALNVVVMMGLAVGIDYSLVCVDRWSAILTDTRTGRGAAARVMRTAGRSVALAGLVVIFSLASLLFVPLNVFRDIAVGAMIFVGTSVVMAFTLLPAFLGVLERSPLTRTRRPARAISWGRVVAGGSIRAVAATVGVLLVLGTLALNLLTMDTRLTLPRISDASAAGAAGDSMVAEAQIDETFMSVIDVVIPGDDVRDADASLGRFLHALSNERAFAPFVLVETNSGDRAVVASLLVVHPSDTEEAREAVQTLDAVIVPEAFGGESEVLLTGPLIVFHTVTDILRTWQPIVVGLACAMSAVIILVAFRSLFLVLLTVLTTLLSTAAGLGVLVLVLQDGVGAGVVGLDASASIEVWIPLVVFCIVFGLSLDYQIFLFGAIRNHLEAGAGHERAVEEGTSDIARIIASASMVMIMVFASLAASRITALQQFGFTLAVTVLLDAFLVRLTLVPAVLSIVAKLRTRGGVLVPGT